MKCRHCKKNLTHKFLDLGFSPPSNAYIKFEDLNSLEKTYPLRIWVCNYCWLVQTEIYYEASDLFNSEYAYFSSTSSSMVNHAALYVKSVTQKLGLNEKSLVLEIASNDGYLLKNFKEKNIPCIGIEPTESTANESRKIGIEVIQEFFSEKVGNKLLSEGKLADLLIGNNVYGHVPDINDFTLGMKAALKFKGTITLEFPHILNLIKKNQFDTIYHEHFSYLSLFTVINIFKSSGLKIYDVEQLDTHGGSLRVYGCHDNDPRDICTSVEQLLRQEKNFKLQEIKTYVGFQDSINKIKNDFLLFLIDLKKKGCQVAAYGAAAKANTILNYAGVKTDLLPFICDAAISKQGKYMPGSKIPILHPSKLFEYCPDYIIIFPWNIESEIISILQKSIDKKTKFVTIIPRLKIL